jgi:hypothetical protein
LKATQEWEKNAGVDATVAIITLRGRGRKEEGKRVYRGDHYGKTKSADVPSTREKAAGRETTFNTSLFSCCASAIPAPLMWWSSFFSFWCEFIKSKTRGE